MIKSQGGGDISVGGQWLKEPGTYHVMITEATESPVDRNDVPIPGGLLGLTVSVLAGTVGKQENKCTEITLYDPDQSDTDEKRARSQKALDKLAIACNYATKQSVLAKQPYSFSAGDLVGQQMVVKFVLDRNGKYLRAWDEFYHVDDEDVAGIPKSAATLGAIRGDRRWTAAQKAEAKRATAALSTPPQPVAPPAAPPAPVAPPAPMTASYDAGSL